MAKAELTKSARDYLAAIGRKGGEIGGKSTSEAKRLAARTNGAKGGRPRKVEGVSEARQA